MGLTVLPELVVRALPDERRRAQVRPFALPRPVREVSLLTARVESRGDAARAVAACVRESVVVGRRDRSSTRIVPPSSDEALARADKRS